MAKVMISLPEDLLARLDEEAKLRGTSRSGLLAAAARRELERGRPAEIDAAIARSRSRFARSKAFESAAMVRAERDRH